MAVSCGPAWCGQSPPLPGDGPVSALQTSPGTTHVPVVGTSAAVNGKPMQFVLKFMAVSGDGLRAGINSSVRPQVQRREGTFRSSMSEAMEVLMTPGLGDRLTGQTWP